MAAKNASYAGEIVALGVVVIGGAALYAFSKRKSTSSGGSGSSGSSYGAPTYYPPDYQYPKSGSGSGSGGSSPLNDMFRGMKNGATSLFAAPISTGNKAADALLSGSTVSSGEAGLANAILGAAYDGTSNSVDGQGMLDAGSALTFGDGALDGYSIPSESLDSGSGFSNWFSGWFQDLPGSGSGSSMPDGSIDSTGGYASTVGVSDLGYIGGDSGGGDSFSGGGMSAYDGGSGSWGGGGDTSGGDYGGDGGYGAGSGGGGGQYDSGNEDYSAE